MNEYVFDDLQIGKQETLVVEITPEDIDDFADFSGDFSSIHMNDAYAKSRGFNSRLAHGLQVGAYLSAFLGMKLPGKHGLLQAIQSQFRAPCYAPNTLTITGRIIRRSEAVKVVTIQFTVVDREGTEIVRAEANSVLKH